MSSLLITTMPLLTNAPMFTRGVRSTLTLTGVPGQNCTVTVISRGVLHLFGAWMPFTAEVFWDSVTHSLQPTHDDIDVAAADIDTLTEAHRRIIDSFAAVARSCALNAGMRWDLHCDADEPWTIPAAPYPPHLADRNTNAALLNCGPPAMDHNGRR